MISLVTKRSWRIFAAISILAGAIAIWQTTISMLAWHAVVASPTWGGLLGLETLTILAGIAMLTVTFLPGWPAIQARLTEGLAAGRAGRTAGVAALLAVWAAALGLMVVTSLRIRIPVLLYLWLIWWAYNLIVLSLQAITRREWKDCLLPGAVVLGGGLTVFRILSELSTSAFAIDWSETSRFYYGSLLFAEKTYGIDIPWSVWHPTRYMLLSIPFGIGEPTLWDMRVWQVVLWLVMTALAAAAMVIRLGVPRGFLRMLAGIWCFIFFYQGGVYYHLLPIVAIVLLGVSYKHPWRSFAVIVVASLWAGMSRLNWFPVPGMLAAALYFLEKPLDDRRWFRYLLPPAIAILAGTGVSLAAQAAYVGLSGNAGNVQAFGSSFTSDLLWYRLLPNATYQPGVLPGILLYTFPLLYIAFSRLRGRAAGWHPSRLAGLAALPLVLFAGGLVVSVKIGGGGDLHNMDAFQVTLALIAGYALFHKYREGSLRSNNRWVALAVAVPVLFAFAQTVTTTFVAPHPDEEKVLTVLRIRAEAAAQQGRPILFVTQRHLVTFGMIDTPLAPEYELLTLNEMSLSRNAVYMQQYYSDIDAHRYAYVVIFPQYLGLKDRSRSFNEEDNIWVRNVGRYLSCEYQVEDLFTDLQIAILAPNTDNPDCEAERGLRP